MLSADSQAPHKHELVRHEKKFMLRDRRDHDTAHWASPVVVRQAPQSGHKRIVNTLKPKEHGAVCFVRIKFQGCKT